MQVTLDCGCIIEQDFGCLINSMPIFTYNHACPEHFKLHLKLKDNLDRHGNIPEQLYINCFKCGKYRLCNVDIENNTFLCIYCK